MKRSFDRSGLGFLVEVEKEMRLEAAHLLDQWDVRKLQFHSILKSRICLTEGLANRTLPITTALGRKYEAKRRLCNRILFRLSNGRRGYEGPSHEAEHEKLSKVSKAPKKL